MIVKTVHQPFDRKLNQPLCQTLLFISFILGFFQPIIISFWTGEITLATGQWIAVQLPPDKGIERVGVKKSLLTAIFRNRLWNPPVRAERFPLFSHFRSWQSLLLMFEELGRSGLACARGWHGCLWAAGHVVPGEGPALPGMVQPPGTSLGCGATAPRAFARLFLWLSCLVFGH